MSISVACISDTHVGPLHDTESEAMFPRWVKSLGPEKGQEWFSRVQRGVQTASNAALQEVERLQPDLSVHLGDAVGGWREQGIRRNPELIDLLIEMRDKLRMSSGSSYFCLGHHDTGYTKRGSLEGSGIHPESVITCEEIVGPLHWKHQTGDMLSLGICASLDGYDGYEPEILRRQNDQEEAFASRLEGHKGLPWVLYTHEPLSERTVIGQICSTHLEECTAIVHGDLHDPRKALMLNLLQKFSSSRSNVQKRMNDLRVCCPSPAPLWWRGYEMLEGTYDDEGAVRFARRRLERPKDQEPLETESMLRCLWALLVKR